MCSLGWFNEGVQCPLLQPHGPTPRLLAKGEDRRQRILAVAERLLARNGWRNTSLAQIAKEAGVTPAGLLHHFESKEQLLNAVLDARDADDDAHADYRSGDLITELSRVPERFERAPELVGTFTVLLVENIAPDAPLHDRLHKRYRDAVDIITEIIERGQQRRTLRPDFDAATKAVEILAFINGMETLWLLDPSIPLTEVFKGYAESLAPRAGSRTELDMRYRLDVVAPTVLDAVKFAGGWVYDRVMAGWDVTVLIGSDEDVRPLEILGAEVRDLESVLESWEDRPIRRRLRLPPTCSTAIPGCATHVLNALEQGATEVTLWGERLPAELDSSVDSVQHRLSAAARAFKAQALAAASDSDTEAVGRTETFRCGMMASVAADLIPAS